MAISSPDPHGCGTARTQSTSFAFRQGGAPASRNRDQRSWPLRLRRDRALELFEAVNTIRLAVSRRHRNEETADHAITPRIVGDGDLVARRNRLFDEAAAHHAPDA